MNYELLLLKPNNMLALRSLKGEGGKPFMNPEPLTIEILPEIGANTFQTPFHSL
jgi:hypothetical protein